MEKPADAVVFLGPELHTSWNLPKNAVLPQANQPACFYVQFYSPLPAYRRDVDARDQGSVTRPGFGFGPPGSPACQAYPQAMPNVGLGDEPIASLVGRLNGRVFPVGSPQEFARAVRRILQRNDRH